MRRMLVATTIATLLTAAAAYAASSAYTGSLTFTNHRAGSAAHPAPVGFTLNVAAAPTGSDRPPVQLDVKVKIYGLIQDGKDFPACSLAEIAAAGNDDVCPKGAEVATGYIHSMLGSATDFTKPGAACDPQLDVWNSGQGKMTYFFVTNATHQCLSGALKTGGTPPYPGTYKVVHGWFISDVPVPRAIDYPVGGLVGSLVSEHLVFRTQSRTMRGHHVAATASVRCLKHRRPYQIINTYTSPTLGTHVSTVAKSAAC